jgi:hypothetical protein
MSKRHNDKKPARLPWNQMPGEGDSAYRAFLAYRDLGPGRTRIGAVQVLRERSIVEPGKGVGGRYQVWASGFKWLERARAWDNHLQDQKDKVARQYAAKWEARRLKALDEAWENADKLQEKALRMMEIPVSQQKMMKDGKTIIVQPGKWTFGTAAEMLRLAADMKAAALHAATEPLERCTNEELKAIEEATHAAKLLQVTGT